MCKGTNNVLNNSYTDNVFCQMEDDYLKLIQTIESFRGFTNTPINSSDLEIFPLMKWVDIGGGIEIRKRKNRFGNYLNFDTKMDIGAEFGNHFHDDIIESCEVVSGLLYDKLTRKHYKAGDVAHYEKSERHEPIAMEETFLHVLFKP